MQIKNINNKTVVCNYNPKDRGIYRWTFVSKGSSEIYIGQTAVSFERRTKQHLSQVAKNTHSRDFQNAWNKCERVIIDSIEIMDSDNKSDYLLEEKLWIGKYGGLGSLVNCICSYGDFFKKKNLCE